MRDLILEFFSLLVCQKGALLGLNSGHGVATESELNRRHKAMEDCENHFCNDQERVDVQEKFYWPHDRRGEGQEALSFNHYHHSRKMCRVELNEYEYEFSCSNSPDPVIVHSAKNKSQRFPCMRLPKVIEDFVEDEPVYPETLVCMAKTPEYMFNIQIERCSPLFSPSTEGVSNYSSDDEGDGKYGQVDHKAEEFIARFHDQLRKQIVH